MSADVSVNVDVVGDGDGDGDRRFINERSFMNGRGTCGSSSPSPSPFRSTTTSTITPTWVGDADAQARTQLQICLSEGTVPVASNATRKIFEHAFTASQHPSASDA